MAKRNVCAKSREEQRYVRDALKKKLAEGETVRGLARAAGVDHGSLSKITNGKIRPSDDTVEALYSCGAIARPTESDLEAFAPKKKSAPLPSWGGEIKTTAEAGQDKGYSDRTIRRMAADGRLDYIRVGRRIMIVVNAKYRTLSPSAGRRADLAEAECERLRRDLEEARARIVELEASAIGTHEFLSADGDDEEPRCACGAELVNADEIREGVCTTCAYLHAPAPASIDVCRDCGADGETILGQCRDCSDFWPVRNPAGEEITDWLVKNRDEEDGSRRFLDCRNGSPRPGRIKSPPAGLFTEYAEACVYVPDDVLDRLEGRL